MSYDHLKEIPQLPGIYIFKNKHNHILYIGKAKNLRKRVATYFQKQETDWKIKALISEHATIDYIVTKNEHEALLLEAQMVREYQPKFNVLLTSGNPFVYIFFTRGNPPVMELVRTKKEVGTYFGPFIHKQDARRAFNFLTHTFKLALCSSKQKNGCLNYHLGRCAGNCTLDFDINEYLMRLELAQQVLKGDHQAFLKTLQEKIKEYTAQKEFERAKHLYDYIKNLDYIFATLKTHFSETKYSREIAHATASQELLLKRAPSALKGAAHELQRLLQLDQPICTIDCFDISHFQSNALVGSCIRFTDGVPDKAHFRKFKIKTLTEQDDYAALAEIVQRRYRNIEETPDLVLIDGGKGQRNAVKDLIPQVPCISIAKREERIFGDAFPEGIILDPHSELGQLLIALRDYAHHFAISYHRLLRQKKTFL